MQEIERILNRISLDLEAEKRRLLWIESSIDRIEKDKFSHLPLVPLYKRPPIPPNYF